MSAERLGTSAVLLEVQRLDGAHVRPAGQDDSGGFRVRVIARRMLAEAKDTYWLHRGIRFDYGAGGQFFDAKLDLATLGVCAVVPTLVALVHAGCSDARLASDFGCLLAV